MLVKKQKLKSFTLRLHEGDVEMLKKIANYNGIRQYQPMVRSWIVDKIRKELRKNPEIKK